MKKFFYLLFLPLALFGADAANDLILTQVNSSNTGNTQRNVAPVASGFLTFDASKVPTSPAGLTWVSPTLGVPASFSLTGAGSLAFAAGGSNQSINILPSGTGGVGIGTAGATTGPRVNILSRSATTTPTFSTFGSTNDGLGIWNEATAGITIGTAVASGRSVINFRRSRGTLAAPTTVADGDALMTIGSSGWEGSGNFGGGSVDATVDGAVSTGIVPTKLVLSATSVLGSRNQQVELKPNGSFRIGITDVTSAAWSTTGVNLVSFGRTITDSSSSGTVAAAVGNSFGVPTFSTPVSVTYTNAANVYIAGDVAFAGSASATNTYGLWNAGKTRLDDIVSVNGPTTAGASTYQLMNVSGSSIANAAGNTDYRSFTSFAILTGSNAATAATALQADVRNSTSATVGTLQGFSGSIRVTSTGNTTNGYGIRTIAVLSAAGNMTNYSGFNSRSPSLTSTGTISDARGIYIEAQKITGVTTGYGIYQEGTSDLNFFGGKITTYNNLATAGNGIASVQGAARVTAQTGANASVTTYTVGASDASFLVSANVNVTASTTHSFTTTCVYTDEGNVSRTLTFGFTQLSGATFITAITNVTGTGPYESPQYHIRCKAATTITIATTGTFTSVTYNAEGAIVKVL